MFSDPSQELGVVVGVPGPPPLGLPGPLKALLPVLADRLQQPVTGLGPSVFGHHQRPRHQARQQVEHRAGIDAVPAADRLGRLQGGAADEHRQPREQDLFGPG